MDLDFLLFTPPKRKINFVDFWGETIFVPKDVPKGKQESGLAAFLNCYQPTTSHETHLNVQAALLDSRGLDVQSEMTSSTIAEGKEGKGRGKEEQLPQRHIPCLFLNSMVGSKYLLVYFHASGEDIGLSRKLLDLLRNLYQVNVLAMQYPGYSIYRGKPNSQVIREDAHHVYQFAVNKLGFREEDIIVIGRSIGTGIALQLLQKAKPGALVLISPFASIKSLAREFAGLLGSLVAKQSYNNRVNITSVSCPTFFLHGLRDETISADNTRELAKLCFQKNKVELAPTMTHSTFDFYSDLADPLREFLMARGFNFYDSGHKGPQLPDSLFQFPDNFQF